MLQIYPWVEPPPQADPPPRTDTPSGRPSQQTATAADGAHPIGMHSCYCD